MCVVLVEHMQITRGITPNTTTPPNLADRWVKARGACPMSTASNSISPSILNGRRSWFHPLQKSQHCRLRSYGVTYIVVPNGQFIRTPRVW